MSSFYPKDGTQQYFYDSGKAACLGKMLFLSYYPKCYQLIRLWDSLIINISGRNPLISLIFLHVDNFKNEGSI